MEADEFTARLMSDMDSDLLEFIRSRINSFIKWDLVRFFHENPHTADTVDNIAKSAGRNVDAVEPELEELDQSGIMQKTELGDTSIYTLVTDTEMRSLVDKFIMACEDRHFRVKAVYHIIRGMR